MNDAQSIDELVLEHLLINKPNPVSKAFYEKLKAEYGKEKASRAIREMEEDGLVTPCTMRTLVGYFVTPNKINLTARGEAVAEEWSK